VPAAPQNHVALLRAVNVAGHQIIGMADLRAWLTRLGFSDVRSLLQSGNLVFKGGAKSGAQLERMLEAAAAKQLKLETDFFVRSAAEWRDVIEHNPYPAEAERDPGHLLVMCLKEAPRDAAVRALQAAITGRETVRAWGAHAYLVYPDGVGRSRLTTALIERTLGTRGTGRNWNTVLKLEAAIQA
jgi:uncharacterized protein (DUF1697 family)